MSTHTVDITKESSTSEYDNFEVIYAEDRDCVVSYNKGRYARYVSIQDSEIDEVKVYVKDIDNLIKALEKIKEFID